MCVVVGMTMTVVVPVAVRVVELLALRLDRRSQGLPGRRAFAHRGVFGTQPVDPGVEPLAGRGGNATELQAGVHLARGLLAGLGLAAVPAPFRAAVTPIASPLEILVLGGTGFLGPLLMGMAMGLVAGYLLEGVSRGQLKPEIAQHAETIAINYAPHYEYLDDFSHGNGLSAFHKDLLDQALDAAAADSEIKALVLTGAGGKAFVAGADI